MLVFTKTATKIYDSILQSQILHLVLAAKFNKTFLINRIDLSFFFCENNSSKIFRLVLFIENQYTRCLMNCK